jgi:hypothetical protein
MGTVGRSQRPVIYDYRGALDFHTLSPLLANRSLRNNQLTSLEVGVFDKNTALTTLYVDQGKMISGTKIRRGAVKRVLDPLDVSA